MGFREHSKILVKAPAGHPCPRRGLPGEFITEAPVLVPNDHYHRALLADGSLEAAAEREPVETQGERAASKPEENNARRKTPIREDS